MSTQSGEPKTAQPSSQGWTVSVVSAAVAVVWAFAVMYHPVLPAANADLDPSWAQALGEALIRGLAFGRDVIFTYGPMGYFWVPLYQPELFGWHFAWELLLKSFQAIIIVVAVTAWESPVKRVLVFSCAIVSLGVSHDATAFLTIICGVLILARHTRPHPALACVVLITCALLSLQKFTCLLLAIASFIGLMAALLERGRKREAGAYPLGFVVVFVVSWAAVGQPVAAIPDYIWSSWQITSGFSRAMAMSYDPAEQKIALVAVGLGMALVLVGLTRRRSLHDVALSGVIVLGFFVAWKAGFVRSAEHTRITFAFVALSPLWIGLMPTLGVGRVAASGAAIMVTLGMLGLQHANSSMDWARTAYRRPMGTWLELSAPGKARARLELALANTRQEHALPRTRDRVGDASIDVLPWGVGALFLNDLDWRPRPVFQSYSAYTPSLSKLNAEHFRSDDRPRFVLAHEGTIDQRHPLQDDGEAWIEILRLYDPVLYEEGFLLFQEREGAPPPGEPELLFETVLRPGEELDVSALGVDACYLAIQIELDENWLGRLRSVLYRGPSVFLRTRFGPSVLARHRLIPGMAERGFLITPAAHGMVSWLFHFAGVELAQPTSLELEIRSRDRKLFEPGATVRVHALDRLLARDCDSKVGLGTFPGLSRLPDTLTPPYSFRYFTRTPKGLLAHAPSEMTFELAPGVHDLSLRYAIGEGAYTIGATDGVIFKAAVIETDDSGIDFGEQTIFERHLRPVAVEQDRGVQTFRGRFELPTAGRLLLETAPGPDGDVGWDWSIWLDVSIDRPDVDRPTGDRG